jgi:hypothetical protein
MRRLAKIRSAIQAKILAQYPQLNEEAIEPYCRLMCRHVLSLAAQDADAFDADPALGHECRVLEASFAEEMAALRDVLPEVLDALDAQAGDDDSRVEPLAIQTMEAFINGEVQPTPLSLEAIRARVDAGTYLLSR